MLTKQYLNTEFFSRFNYPRHEYITHVVSFASIVHRPFPPVKSISCVFCMRFLCFICHDSITHDLTQHMVSTWLIDIYELQHHSRLDPAHG